MKIILILISLLTVNFLAADDIGSVRVSVNNRASTDYGKNESKTQEQKLAITLTNTGKASINNLSIRWTMYGHNVKDRKLVVLDSGEIKGKLDQSSTETMESTVVKIHSQREASVSSRGRGGRGGRGRTSVKKIPASGSTYYGYAVSVYDGDKLISTTYSHPSIKDQESP